MPPEAMPRTWTRWAVPGRPASLSALSSMSLRPHCQLLMQPSWICCSPAEYGPSKSQEAITRAPDRPATCAALWSEVITTRPAITRTTVAVVRMQRRCALCMWSPIFAILFTRPEDILWLLLLRVYGQDENTCRPRGLDHEYPVSALPARAGKRGYGKSPTAEGLGSGSVRLDTQLRSHDKRRAACTPVQRG